MTDTELLEALLHEARKSDCDKIKFGAAALTWDGKVRGCGFNHNPRVQEDWSCAERCAGGIRKGVKSGTCVELCYSVHAEQHALLAGYGLYEIFDIQLPEGALFPVNEIAVAGLLPDGSLFDNGGGFYCTVCARFMAAAGIQFVSIWTKGQRKRLTIQEAWDQSYGIATAPR